MDINAGNLSALFTSFRLLFTRGAQTVDKAYLKFTMEIVSTTAVEIYGWLNSIGKMKEWLSDRDIENISSEKLEVRNRKFEKTIAVTRDSLEDDQIGVYSPIMADLGFEAESLWGDLAAEALAAANVTKWADGKTFCATDRKYGKQTINNKATAALSVESFEAGMLAMRQYKGHKGNLLKVKPTLLVHGPANRTTAFNLVKNEWIVQAAGSVGAGAIKNPNFGAVETLELDNLGSEWFLLDCSRPYKPVGVQKRRMPELIAKDDPKTSDRAFMRDEYLYGASARGEAFLTLPHLVYGSFPIA